ncbi:hypothetical protein OIU34_23265 [Pararhizobium sp. BT-229]|uniref:hypothetical protein n=1 Tax=Pararhizobium sp. BT-229 TaxID=2986923 RepID=UPI0021F76A77|nr:hypothetical protein [Pararhizobium sp. BT-229]MCV9964816.1 hypothetical protein [Pararhizobium sp. BT-229]
MVAELRNHVLQFSDWFNEAAAKQRLGITLDPTAVVRHIENTLPDHVTKLYGQMTEHMVHKEQVQTAIDAIARTIAEPGKSGIVLGALQSGKTGTAFMTLFAAPVHYLKSRVTFVPLFMTTNQNSHLMQTQKAMRGFFDLYGGINIVSDGKTHSLIDYYQQSGADLVETQEGETEITLRGYHTRLGEEMYPGSDPVEALVKGMTVKRVPGGISKKVRSYCERARDRGHGVMLIVDEPQYGASNQIKKNGDEVECLLSRLFAEVDEDFFSPDTPNFMIGLSATPFDTAYLSNLWRVNQRLNRSYVGPNVFGGMRIDDSVITKAPKVASFKEVARVKGLDWFGEISYLIGAAKKPERSSFKATTVGEDGERREMKFFERKQKGADLVRALFDSHLLKRQANSGEPVGALLRIANNKRLTEEIVEAMAIAGPDSPYNVIRFYGANGDIKQLIWEATRNDKRPYIVVTVGKGRMGDAFPASTVMATDLTNSPTDANAFLQGVYGRMCGYGKRDPVVFVSDKSKELHAQYMENLGATPEFDLSKHVKTTVLSKGRNHRESYFMITDEMIDSDHENSPLRSFRADIIAYLEQQELSKETLNQNVPKRENQFMNLPELMARHGLINYVAENSRRLDPELQDPARIVEPARTYGATARRSRSGTTSSETTSKSLSARSPTTASTRRMKLA